MMLQTKCNYSKQAKDRLSYYDIQAATKLWKIMTHRSLQD